MDVPYYPLNDYEPLMKGMIIGGMGIFHVFLAQFAIGGGLLMCWFQWLSQSGREPAARGFLEGYFKYLVLISFVVGAITGVGMWFTTIQISPRTIGLLLEQFHWIWAIEWTFFCLEVVSGYAFYRYGRQLSERSRMTLLVFYSVAAWCSLFWINGILSWQLTPGAWLERHTLWSGFFNPSFWPSLIFRTFSSMTIAALASCVVIGTMTHTEGIVARQRLIHWASYFLLPMVLMPLLGWWFMAVIPADSRRWVLGGSVAMTLFMLLAVSASLLIGLYSLIGLVIRRIYINAATAGLLLALAFGATAGGEFVREGSRKPCTVRHTLLANSIRPEEIGQLRAVGSVSQDPYPVRDARDYPNEQLILGAKVFRFQCSVCHTMEGANGLVHLAGSWTLEQRRQNIAKLQHTKTFMPPFSGTPEELEAIVQLIAWRAADRPKDWPVSSDAVVLTQIKKWLDEVGVEPAQPELRSPTADSK